MTPFHKSNLTSILRLTTALGLGLTLGLGLSLVAPLKAQQTDVLLHKKTKATWQILDSSLVFNHAPFASCHASTLTMTADGRLLIACFGGSHEGAEDVGIWVTSRSGPGVYTGPVQVATGDPDASTSGGARVPLWNPVLYTRKDGSILLYYKKGSSPRTWKGYYKISRNNGQDWSHAQALPAGILGPIKNKPVPGPGSVLLCPSSVEQENGKWYAAVEITKDGEHSWSSYPVDSANSWGVIQPTILSYDHGKRYQALLRSNQNYILQSWSGDALHWSKLEKTPLRNPNSGIDAVTLKDGTQLLVYNPAGSGKNWWDGRAHLNVAISMDGINWQDILMLEAHDKGEYSYPAVIQAPNGHVFISYTYDRQNIKLIELVKRR